MNQLLGLCQVGVRHGRPALQGPCDSDACEHVDWWLSRLLPRELDMSEVTALDVSGVRVLVDARLRDKGFRVVNPSEVVRRVLERSGTLEYLTGPVAPSRKERRS